MRSFLNEAMSELNTLSKEKQEQWKKEFIASLETSKALFGKHIFSKTLLTSSSKPTLNRGLFEVITVLTAVMTAGERKRYLIKGSF